MANTLIRNFKSYTKFWIQQNFGVLVMTLVATSKSKTVQADTSNVIFVAKTESLKWFIDLLIY